ncbi:signal peptide peptidase SppA, 67K type [Oceanimonas sp. GK1]|uniref:signal peptide peptidase SppA n=1 Tax=Oceanimonas sp. (strain GK1 / IBRC-M 10197) TaxID=511062 RepID=UPI000249504D|nr:signal peptide peptidase SppA [Oceanimonas sp. GK1]AEY02210.1 signal peptide peptidase SppA, 67K type [Oceanimonas sp. GK1]
MWSAIKWLFRTLGRVLSVLRTVLINLFFLLALLSVFIIFFSEKEAPTLPASAALTLEINGAVLEQDAQASPRRLLNKWLAGDQAPPALTLGQIKEALNQARVDDRIKAVVLRLQNMSESSLTKLDEIGAALESFKTSGKPVYAIGDYYTQGQYYLAAHADEIWLNPAGAVTIQGLGVYRLHYKSAFERFDITPHVFRVGTYKSFVEPYLRDDMSDESREDALRWLGQLWRHYQDNVSTLRNIPADHISPGKELLLSRFRAVGGDPARYALEQGLVDQLATRHDMLRHVGKQVGWDHSADSYQSLGVSRYLAHRAETGNTAPAVGLITASGAIMSGEPAPNTISDEQLGKLIDQARRDHEINALVLRIDSPGGSAFAAEQIRAALLRFKQSGKPLVVSMGSTAASGGYWIAADADKIYAAPTTLTGSIGVFGLFLTFEDALEKLGLNTDGVGTTDFVGAGLTTGLPEHAQELIQLGVEHTYERFVTLVAEGRELEPRQVEAAAQGHVWTGTDAQALGLVDELGYLDDALAGAAELAGLAEYRLKRIQLPRSPKELLMDQLLTSNLDARGLMESALPEVLRPAGVQLGNELDALSRFNDVRGQYVLCVECQEF